jgi:hypothetical protein
MSGPLAKILGVDVTAGNTSAQEHELGLEVWVSGIKYTYVQADDAVTLYDAVTLDVAAAGSGTAANAPWLVTPTGAAAVSMSGIAGVTAFTAGYYGWIITGGKAFVQAETAVAALDFLAPSAVAGELITQPSTAVNPVTADFDSALGSIHGHGAVALEAEGATTAGFAYCIVF